MPGPMFLLGGLCPEAGLCPGVVSVQGGLCPGGSLSRGLPDSDPLDKDPPYGEGRAVRILLECFLV